MKFKINPTFTVKNNPIVLHQMPIISMIKQQITHDTFRQLKMQHHSSEGERKPSQKSVLTRDILCLDVW